MAEEQPLTFKVNGREYPVPTELTVGEMCDAERFFGVEFGSEETSGMRMASALLWIAIRRVDQTVTVDDIRELPADVFAGFAEGDAVPPANAAAGNETSGTSGASLSNGSASPGASPAPTGVPG